MGRRRKPVKVDFVQVPEEFRQAKSGALAAILTAKLGKRVERAEALALAVDLWAWHLQLVSDRAPNLVDAFRVAGFIPAAEAHTRVSLATGWPVAKAQALLDALSHDMVGILIPTGDGYTVAELQDRYMLVATRQHGNRARAKLSNLAHEHGWEPDDSKKGMWRHRGTGETDVHWRDLLVRLGGAP